MPASPTINYVAEISFISQPIGGNDATSLTFAPILFIAVGLETHD